MTISELFDQYNWWQLYIFFGLSYLIIFNMVILPKIWRRAKLLTGTIRWSKGPYSKPVNRVSHIIINNIVQAALYPVAVLIFIIDEGTFIHHMANPIIDDVMKEQEEK